MTHEQSFGSREDFEAVCNSMPLGMAIFSLDGRYLHINSRLAEINGLPVRDHIGKHIADIVPSLADQAAKIIARILSSGETVSGAEFSGETPAAPGQQHFWCEHWAPVRDGAGRISAISVLVEDITARRQTEAALRASEATLKAILDALPLGVGVTDMAGKVTLANAMFRACVSEHIPSGDPGSVSLWEAYDDDGKRIGPENYPGVRALRGDRVVPGVDFLFSAPGQPPRWMRVAAVPQRGAGGAITGAIATIQDIDGERRSLNALREQQQLLQSVVANASLALFIMDEHQQCVFMNPAAEQLTGFSLAEVKGRALHDVIHHTRPDGSPYPLSECPIDQAFPKNDRESGEEVFVHKDGHFYTVRFTASPIPGNGGQPTGTVIEVQDITVQKQDEQRLEQSEALFRTVSEALPNFVFLHDSEGQNSFVNRSFCAFAGRETEGLLDNRWADLVHPDDLKGARERWIEAVRRAEPFESEYRFRRHDGEWRWHLVRTVPLNLESGRVTQWIGTATDITSRIKSEQQIRTLMLEVNHRSKNLLAVVQAVANNTARGSDPEKFAAGLSNRLQGLAASHDLLVHHQWKGVDLASLVTSQLAYFSGHIGSRIICNGPAFRITASAAQSIGMALHELVTNAAKHGSLSVDAGTLDVAWRVTEADGSDKLLLIWTERGGPLVSEPVNKGFGSKVLGRLVEQSTQGKVEVRFDPEGLTWRLDAPVYAVVDSGP